MANTFDLTERCALCGGELEYVAKYNPRLLPDGSYKMDREATGDDIDEARSHCACTSRIDRGRCGRCTACRIERHGCACDGAFDAGCFNCTPSEFKRPACPIS